MQLIVVSASREFAFSTLPTHALVYSTNNVKVAGNTPLYSSGLLIESCFTGVGGCFSIAYPVLHFRLFFIRAKLRLGLLYLNLAIGMLK